MLVIFGICATSFGKKKSVKCTNDDKKLNFN